MDIKYFFDDDTSTFTYIVTDPSTNKCAIIDPVLDYNPLSGNTSTSSPEKVIDYITENKIKVEWILETHAHADHLTSANLLQKKFNAKIGIGENIKKVIEYWVPLFNTFKDTPLDGSQFNHLFKDGEKFKIGNLEVEVIYTPGHTPACLSYLIEDAVFVGDTLMMPHMGTARTDFPGGSAETLYKSIQKLFTLPDNVRAFVCHDYPVQGSKPECFTSIAEHKLANSMINSGVNEKEYVINRNNKDNNKEVPRLLLPSIQVNLRAGSFGKNEDNGISYVKIPINKL